jgi:prepilin-type N-terminal cleavage/methylation domain-containing protein
MSSKSNRHRRANKGYTLLEVLLVLAVVGIVAGLGVPSLNDSITRTRVKGAAEGVYGLILQAKAEGPIRDSNLSFNTNPAAVPWCAGFSVTPNCDCTNTTSCVVSVSGTSVLQVLNGTDYPGVTMTENFATGSGTTFNRIRGSASQAGTVGISSGNWALSLVISADGRTRICNPNDASNSIPGYRAC